ncbi:hypothetical protein GCM10023340_11220 [Nocardioides marinquilinus]|uniref:Uncharacterized protein n=1 Tax=Nocardioides marinquilinus TaxID=1210400 RepID=A0ABP9PBW6_9ACTN
MRTLLTRGLAALVAAGCLAAVAPAAHAETWRTTDRWHDVRSVDTTSLEDRPSVPAPRNRGSDITALQVAHGPRWITVEVSLREVRPRDRIVIVELDLPGRIDATLMTIRTDGQTLTSAWLEEGLSEYDPCRSGSTTLPRAGMVRLSVRRDCLGDPAWVRANALVATGSRESLDDSPRTLLDVALGRPGTHGSPTTYGPRVHVG